MRSLCAPVFVAFLVAAAGCGPDAGERAPRWAEEPTLEDSGWLMNLWARSGDDIWAVGGSPDEGRVRHSDGHAWSTLDVGDDVPLLDWVHGFAADDVWVVGREGTVLHYDGTSFARETVPTDEDLWGVWGSSATDLWVVGGSGFPEATPTLLHRGEDGFESVELPTLMRSNVHAFFKVWGSSKDDVWVVGQRGVVLHYDGDVWEERLAGSSEDLISVWGTGPDRVAFVGGRGNGVLITWDGAEFRPIDLDFAPGLNGVWMRSPDVIHVAGVRGTLRAYAWDGTPMRTDDRSTNLDFHSIHGDPGGRLWAVGGSIVSTSEPFEGLAWARTLEKSE